MATTKNRILAVQFLPGDVLWAEVEMRGSSPILRETGRVPLRAHGENTNRNQRETLREALSSIWDRTAHSWIEQPEAFLLFPDSRVTSRYLEIPSTDPERIRNVISFEVSEEIQLPLEEIVWDHLPFSESESGTRVLWLAARKSSLSEILDELPPDYPPPAVITPALVGSAVLAKPSIKEEKNQAGIVLDLQTTSATLLVQNVEGVFYARSIAVGTVDEVGSPAEDMPDMARNLSREITRTYSYARQRFKTLAIQRVLIAGFNSESLAREIAPPRGLKVESLDHIAALEALGLSRKDASRVPNESASLVASAVQRLAHRDRIPNFAPPVAAGQISKSLGKLAGVVSGRFLVVAAVLLALCVGTAVGSSVWRRSAIDARQAKTTDLLKKVRDLQHEQKTLREIQKERVNFSTMFMDLAEQIPENITISDIHFDLRTKFTMKGTAQSNQDVDKLIKILQEMHYFRDVTVQKTAFEQQSLVFQIEGKIRPGAERGKKE
ncbi:MAG: PilN domain-containing protein [bacterium]